MGSDDIFKKKRKTREKRKHDQKSINTDSYLIVTEGVETEPSYFNGLKAHVLEKTKGKIDVIPSINVKGQGMHTMSLVDKAALLNRNSNISYSHIWIVMDKDDFVDFDESIESAESRGFKVAWSNQSFEYWLYLHFAYSDAALHRSEWNKKLDEIFKKRGLGDGKYRKNYDNLYELVTLTSSVKKAISYAKKRMELYSIEMLPSNYDPGTTVHNLVEELLSYIEE